MRGGQAVPALDGAQLIDGPFPSSPQGPALEVETILALPGAHLTLSDSLRLARRARDAAAAGEGVVITTGTDTMEELAVLCALVHDGEAPIVLTGANRPGSLPGADGSREPPRCGRESPPPRRRPILGASDRIRRRDPRRDDRAQDRQHRPDRVRVASRRAARSRGRAALVAARAGMLTDHGPRAALDVGRLANRVVVVSTGLGDDGAMLRHASRSADGVVLIALGVRPPAARGDGGASGRAAERVPVVITCRPEWRPLSSMLFSTYGFQGAERWTFLPGQRRDLALRSLARGRPGRRCCAASAPGAGRARRGAGGPCAAVGRRAYDPSRPRSPGPSRRRRPRGGPCRSRSARGPRGRPGTLARPRARPGGRPILRVGYLVVELHRPEPETTTYASSCSRWRWPNGVWKQGHSGNSRPRGGVSRGACGRTRPRGLRRDRRRRRLLPEGSSWCSRASSL